MNWLVICAVHLIEIVCWLLHVSLFMLILTRKVFRYFKGFLEAMEDSFRSLCI